MTGQRGQISISSVNPTVFFIRDGDLLKQMIEVAVSNSGETANLSLKLSSSDLDCDIPIGEVSSGDSTHQLAIPDIREAVHVRFSIFTNGVLQDEKELLWKPGKHWSVHLVQVSHHDLGYTDLPSNIIREYHDFYDDMLVFCRETDDWPEESKFRYTVEQAWSILHYLENCPPDALDEMIRRIKEGRIEVTALFGNQTTEIHGPEELIRALYPALRLKREYGIPITTAELNDIPGLSWGLVKALAGAGIKYFSPGLPTYFDWEYHVRGFWDEDAVLPHGGPDAFWWEAQDGDRVLLWYGSTGAGGTSDPLVPRLAEHLKSSEEQGYPYDVTRYWVQGGHRDNAPPLLDFAERTLEWNQTWAYPRLICGTSAMFFEQLAKEIAPDLRAYRGELPGTDYPIGAISTAQTTAINRNTHDALLSAERFAAIAAEVSDYPYPFEILNEAYDALLLYDEHTWAQADPGGPAQHANWAQKSELAYRAAALAQDISMKALNKIADEIALDDEGHHLIVFNPLPETQTGIFQSEIRPADPCMRPMFRAPRTDELEGPGLFNSSWVLGRWPAEPTLELAEGKFDLVDVETGRSVPFQINRMSGPQDAVPDAAHRWSLAHVDARRFYSLVFLAEDVPPMGYRVYRMVSRNSAPESSASVNVGDNTLENRFYKLTLDPSNGAIASIIDKELGRELVDSDAPHKLNQLIVRSAQTHEEYPVGGVSISKGVSGHVSGSLVVKGAIHGCPQLTQEITMYADVKRIDLATRFLKDSTPLQEVFIAFPFAAEIPKFKYESALSIIEPTVDQFPGSNTDYYAVQHWANVADGDLSITLAGVDAAMMEFGGLWPGYVSQAHHGVPTPEFGHEFLKPGEIEKGWIYSYVLNSNFRTNFQPAQWGDTLFRYSITSGEGDWKEGRAHKFGWSVMLPFESVYMSGSKGGTLSAVTAFCHVEEPNIVMLALKQAEDGDGLILRLWETEGKETSARVHLPFVEIKEALTTNLVEEVDRPLEADRHSLTIPVKAWGVSTVRICS